MMKTRLSFAILIFLVPAVALAVPEAEPQGRPPAPSSCIECHGLLEDGTVTNWTLDAHREAGLGCEACHGGDPSPALAEDPEAAMDPAAGYKPAPDRLEVPRFCGECHADAEFMKSFDPQARVDQLAEYRTSVHGKRNAAGDTKPAICTDCHGVHGIRPVASPDSPVHPMNVPRTCARCHADAALMEPYGIAVDQYAKYSQSVHAAALLEREDTAAPACNDCHGNHGAAPPGVQAVANVCGQCHAREANLFRDSIKKELFEAMEVAECTTCHGNHRIVHPTPERFRSGSAPQVSAGEIVSVEPFSVDFGNLEPGATAQAEWAAVLRPYLAAGDARLLHGVAIAAEGVGLEIDATLQPGDALTPETRQASSEGLVATLTITPLSGVPVKAGDAIRYRLEIEATEALRAVSLHDRSGVGLEIVQGSVCLQCHSLGDECDQATEKMYAAISATDEELREAERLLHRAEVAGMDVGDVQFELNSSGTTAALDARALIHSFDPERFVERTVEARQVASTALAAGMAAQDELHGRRIGLAISLVLIALVLLGLFLKIRELDRVPQRAEKAGSDA